MIEKLIKINWNKYTKSEKNVANWLIKNDWINMSITEISHDSQESISTINRFTKKAGFSGFKDFKWVIKHKLTYESEQEFKSKDNYLNDLIASYQITNKNIREKEVDLIVKKIFEYKKIYLYGESFTYITATYLSRKFSKINIESRVFNVASDLSVILPRENVVNIFISNSGGNPNIKQAAQKIYGKNIFIVYVSSTNNNNIKKYSNVELKGDFYSSIDQNDFEIPFISQYISLWIVDQIFNKYYFLKSENHKKIIDKLSKQKIY